MESNMVAFSSGQGVSGCPSKRWAYGKEGMEESIDDKEGIEGSIEGTKVGERPKDYRRHVMPHND